MRNLIISALGDDHTGIVDEFTDILSRYRANIADSRMVSFAGQFAMILLVEVGDDRAEELSGDLPGIGEKMGLAVTIASGSERVSDGVSGVPYRIRTYAMDQLGLVHRITHVLHEYNGNIEQLDTHLAHGAHGGTPLFSMEMIVTIPAEVRLKTIRDELEQLCEELNCDLDIDRA